LAKGRDKILHNNKIMKITMVNNQQGKKKNIMAKSNVLLHSSFIEREGGREKQIIKSQFLQLKKKTE
jgi:hypothetical protein